MHRQCVERNYVASKKVKNEPKLSPELEGALGQLVDSGKSAGSVSEDDIQLALRDVDVDDDELEDLYGALRSRGIDQQAAQKMIIFAFAAELTEALHDGQLKLQVLDRIGQRLPGGEA